MHNISILCKSSWPGECESSHFRLSSLLRFSRPPSSSEWISMNYWILCCSSLQSCYLSKFCLNKSQWHGAIRQCTFQLWRRISKVRTVKCPNYCHLGFKPQSLNKFRTSFRERFYAHAGEPSIGGFLLCILQNASISHLTVIADLERVGKTGGGGSEQDNLNQTKPPFENSWFKQLHSVKRNYREGELKTIPISCHYSNQESNVCHFTMLIKTRAPPNRVSVYLKHSTVTKHLLTSEIKNVLNVCECLYISTGKICITDFKRSHLGKKCLQTITGNALKVQLNIFWTTHLAKVRLCAEQV